MYVDIVYTLVSSQDNDGSGSMAQSVQTTSVIGVLHRRPRDFSARLIDDGDEIRVRFVAHGRIRPLWSKSQESAIEPAVDRPVDHAPTRGGLPRRAGHGAVPDFITILEAGSRGGEVALSTRILASATRSGRWKDSS
jgi:hypothetical protein